MSSSQRRQRSTSRSSSTRKPNSSFSFTAVHKLQPLLCADRALDVSAWKSLEYCTTLALTTSQSIEPLLFCNSAELVDQFVQNSLHMLQNCVAIQGRVPSSTFIERMFSRVFDINSHLSSCNSKLNHNRASGSTLASKIKNKNTKKESLDMYEEESSSDDDDDDDDADAQRRKTAADKYGTSIDAVDRNERKVSASKLSVVVLGSNPMLLFMLVRFLELYRYAIPASHFSNSWKPLSWSTIEYPLQSLCHAAQRGAQLVELNKSANAVAIAVNESRVCSQLLSFVLSTIHDADSCLAGETSGLLEQLMGHTQEPNSVLATLNRVNTLVMLAFINLYICVDEHPKMKPAVGHVLHVLHCLLRTIKASAICAVHRNSSGSTRRSRQRRRQGEQEEEEDEQQDTKESMVFVSLMLSPAMDGDTLHVLGLENLISSTISTRKQETSRWHANRDSVSYTKRILAVTSETSLHKVVDATLVDKAAMIADRLIGSLVQFNIPVVSLASASKPMMKFDSLSIEETISSDGRTGRANRPHPQTIRAEKKHNRKESIGSDHHIIGRVPHATHTSPATEAVSPNARVCRGSISSRDGVGRGRRQLRQTVGKTSARTDKTATLLASSSSLRTRTTRTRTTRTNAKATKTCKLTASSSAAAAAAGATHRVIAGKTETVSTPKRLHAYTPRAPASGVFDDDDDDDDDVQWLSTSPVTQRASSFGHNLASKLFSPSPRKTKQKTGPRSMIKKRQQRDSIRQEESAGNASNISSSTGPSARGRGIDNKASRISRSSSTKDSNEGSSSTRVINMNNRVGRRITLANARTANTISTTNSVLEPDNMNSRKCRMTSETRRRSINTGRRDNDNIIPSGNSDSDSDSVDIRSINKHKKKPIRNPNPPAIIILDSDSDENLSSLSSSSSVQVISPTNRPMRPLAHKKNSNKENLLRSLHLTREELAFVSGSSSNKRSVAGSSTKANDSGGANLNQWVTRSGKKKVQKRSFVGSSSSSNDNRTEAM